MKGNEYEMGSSKGSHVAECRKGVDSEMLVRTTQYYKIHVVEGTIRIAYAKHFMAYTRCIMTFSDMLCSSAFHHSPSQTRRKKYGNRNIVGQECSVRTHARRLLL